MAARFQIEDVLQEPEVAGRHVDFIRFSLLLHLYVGAERDRQHILFKLSCHFANSLLLKSNSIERFQSMKAFSDLTIEAHELTQRAKYIWAELQRADREITA